MKFLSRSVKWSIVECNYNDGVNTIFTEMLRQGITQFINFYKSFYNQLTPLNQLRFTSIFNLFYWLGAGWLFAYSQFIEDKSLASLFFYATWMAFFMTFVFTRKAINTIKKYTRLKAKSVSTK